MDVHAWELMAFVGLNAALMEGGRGMLQADAKAMEALRKLVAITGRPDLHQAQKDAKLALLEVSITSSNNGSTSGPGTLLAGAGATGAAVGNSSGGVGGGSGETADADKHIMLSYSWEQQPVVLRLAKRCVHCCAVLCCDVMCCAVLCC